MTAQMTVHMKNLSGEWHDVGAVEDVPMRGARRVATPAGDIAVFRTWDGRVFALVDRCPHKQGPLSQGIVHGHAVACPLHNWSIDLATGHPMGADAGKGCTPVAPVTVVDGRIFIAAPAERAP
jgi:nitrite reductase (NADH) small subunit